MTYRQGWGLLAALILVVGLSGGVAAAPPPPQVEEIDAALRATLPDSWSVAAVDVAGETITVCLDLPPEVLLAEDADVIEEVELETAQALMAFSWTSLHVRARDPETGECKALSDFLSEGPAVSARTEAAAPITPYQAQTAASSGSLAGKTIYLSPGHGWQWNGYAWRTQRPPYQDIIEDHNNAEAVEQYLIPYLEQAGATVIPVRERDWNTQRVIVDNDDATGYAEVGTWTTSSLSGYRGGAFRYALTTTGTATAAATWTLDVPQAGRYALYVWVYPGANRAMDAHYTVQHAAGTSDVWLDQRIRQSTWRYLGTFAFYAGSATVTLDNASSEAGKAVVADALRLGGGTFDDLTGIDTTAPSAANRPWWEVATFYYSQWMGMTEESYGDVTARPIFARWNHRGVDEDALYISWHSNGYNGNNTTVWGTVSYIHNGEGYAVTEGSAALRSAIHTEMINDFRAGWDADWRDLGERALNLGELRLLWDEDAATRMPGILLEVAYHDHVENANALKDPRFNQIAARAIYQGIVHYFHGEDAVTLPEPPTHLRVQNQGGGQVRVAWSPSPTDAVGLRGDAATAYRVYTSPDGFAWGAAIPVTGTTVTLTGRPAGETLYVRVAAVNAGGESFPTEVLGVRVGNAPSLLIVNGYDKLNRFGLVQEVDPTEGPNLRMDLERINSRDYTAHHGQAVPAGYAWDSASNEAVASGAVDLTAYAMVDWILGEESTEEDGTLNASERSRLTTFLAQDGALLISGTELAWELGGEGIAPDFLHAQLRTAYVSDDAGTYQVTPVAGRAFEGTGTFLFDAPGEYDADYPDVLTPWSGSTAVAALTYGSGGTAAVQFADGCERLLVLGFPLEVVRPDSRSLVMAKALDFLGECAASAPETGMTTPVDGHYYNTVPLLAGWASGTGVSAVQVQVQRNADGLFWTGTQWTGTASWLNATGTTAWSYTLPALGEGAYTVGARAVAGTVDATPAQVTFTLDTLAPLAPTLITPTGGITLTSGTISFEWSAPLDVGAPLTYALAVDAVTRPVEGPEYEVVVGVGAHCWRVQAVDAAGNAGPWTEEACFATVRGPSVYLPLVLQAYKAEPGPEPVCGLILEDGFESAEGWSYNSAPGSYAERVGTPVYLGSWAAGVGIPAGEAGGGSATYASISRALALPAGASQITFRFWGYGVAEAGDAGDLHYVGLRDAAAAWHSLPMQTTDTWDWEEHTFDLTAYAGQTVTLYIGAKNDGDDETAALYVDDVQVEVCVR